MSSQLDRMEEKLNKIGIIVRALLIDALPVHARDKYFALLEREIEA